MLLRISRCLVVNLAVDSAAVGQLLHEPGTNAYTGHRANNWWARIATPAKVNNLFAVRWPSSVAEELTIFMTRLEVEAILRQKEKASTSSVCVDFKPPFSIEVAIKPYPSHSCQIPEVWWP